MNDEIHTLPHPELQFTPLTGRDASTPSVTLCKLANVVPLSCSSRADGCDEEKRSTKSYFNYSLPPIIICLFRIKIGRYQIKDSTNRYTDIELTCCMRRVEEKTDLCITWGHLIVPSLFRIYLFDKHRSIIFSIGQRRGRGDSSSSRSGSGRKIKGMTIKGQNNNNSHNWMNANEKVLRVKYHREMGIEDGNEMIKGFR